MKLKPLSDRIVLEPISQEEKTKSGIVLPDTIDKEKPEQGKVIAVGPGRILADGKRASMSVKVGDKVFFKGYPEEYEEKDKKYLIISEEDILAIIS